MDGGVCKDGLIDLLSVAQGAQEALVLMGERPGEELVCEEVRTPAQDCRVPLYPLPNLCFDMNGGDVPVFGHGGD